jgi:D-aminoacyl-tRNA deacylase
MKELVRNRDRVQGYDIVIEATHHGPTSLKKPVTFLELGSSEQQWLDMNAALTICKTAVDVLKQEIPLCKRVAIAIGGTHYPSKLSALLLDSDLGLGAIASKHSLENIDEEMIGQMCNRSIEKITHAIVDMKSLKSNKTKILNLIEEAGLDLVTI